MGNQGRGGTPEMLLKAESAGKLGLFGSCTEHQRHPRPVEASRPERNNLDRSNELSESRRRPPACSDACLIADI
jgi:hypothetical protein